MGNQLLLKHAAHSLTRALCGNLVSTIANSNKKDVFKTVNALLNKNNKILHQCNSSQVLANDLAMFFKNKVDNIGTAFNGHGITLS